MRSAFSARVMAGDDTLARMPPPSPPESAAARPLRDWIPDGPLRDPEVILDRFLQWVASTGLEPYPAQEEALLELMTGNHVVLSTPTGSGCTAIPGVGTRPPI